MTLFTVYATVKFNHKMVEIYRSGYSFPDDHGLVKGMRIDLWGLMQNGPNQWMEVKSVGMTEKGAPTVPLPGYDYSVHFHRYVRIASGGPDPYEVSREWMEELTRLGWETPLN